MKIFSVCYYYHYPYHLHMYVQMYIGTECAVPYGCTRWWLGYLILLFCGQVAVLGILSDKYPTNTVLGLGFRI